MARNVSLEQLRSAAADINQTFGLKPPIGIDWNYGRIVESLRSLKEYYEPDVEAIKERISQESNPDLRRLLLARDLFLDNVPKFQEETWKTLKALKLLSPGMIKKLRLKKIEIAEVAEDQTITLVEMGWNVDRREQEEWSVEEWVEELRRSDKPWALFLKRKSLEREIVVLDADAFFELLKEISNLS